MCAFSSAISSSPGSESVRRATSFAIVAVGTKTASSWPSSSATRRSSTLTVGSSRRCSSPTSAFAIASRIPGDGCVFVSERRSITLATLATTIEGKGTMAKSTQTITPYLLYEDVAAALEWLNRAFGFDETLRFTGDGGDVSHAEAWLGDAAIY